MSNLGALLTQAATTGGDDALTFHTGVIEDWNDYSGRNVVRVAGTTVQNVPVLSPTAFTSFRAGQTVALLRFRTSYFLLGAIGTPRVSGTGYGEGGGAAQRIRSARSFTQFASPSYDGSAFVPPDGDGGPYPQVWCYIGPSRAAMVIHSCDVLFTGTPDANFTAYGDQGVQVAGASAIPGWHAINGAYARQTAKAEMTVTSHSVVTADDGLQQGENAFGCIYRTTGSSNGSVGVHYRNRSLTVIPL
jgi:hypothetical protein